MSTVWRFLSQVRGNFDDVWAETILHVDMDSFFVEVERLRDPSLRSRPVAVGGVGPRGVIASASYEAREFGVRSAMPTSTARRLCPDMKVVSPSHGVYSEMSVLVFEVFHTFTPMVEGLSLDEAFLDVAGLTRHYQSSVEVAEAVRASIRSRLGLPCSVGIAPTKFVAKLASEEAKPDGIRHVTAAGQLRFLHALPIDHLWGVGPATLAGLARFGVSTVGELSEIPEGSLSSALGPAHSRHLLDLANGIDPRPVEPDSESKSISAEETFPEDLVDADRLEVVLLSQSQRLAGRLRRGGLRARTITLKLRFSDFRTITRSHTSSDGVDSPRDLFRVARGLLASSYQGAPVRLIGLGCTSLVPGGRPHQMAIGADDAWDQVSEMVHAARERFGERAVEPARLLDISPSETSDEE